MYTEPGKDRLRSSAHRRNGDSVIQHVSSRVKFFVYKFTSWHVGTLTRWHGHIFSSHGTLLRGFANMSRSRVHAIMACRFVFCAKDVFIYELYTESKWLALVRLKAWPSFRHPRIGCFFRDGPKQLSMRVALAARRVRDGDIIAIMVMIIILFT